MRAIAAISVAIFATSPVVAATFTVNSTADRVDANPGDTACETSTPGGECTLRAAVQETNSLPGADTIFLPAGTFLLSLPGPVESFALPATGDLDIQDDLTIAGAGPGETVIDGGGIDRVFDISNLSPIATSFDALTITGGLAFDGGGIRDWSGGTLSLSQCEVLDNEATQNGGGISLQHGALVVVECTIAANRSLNAAGIDVGGFLDVVAGLELRDSTVSGNAALNSHGGVRIAADADVLITNTTISSNTADGFLGGIGCTAGQHVCSIRLANVTIAENVGQSVGGLLAGSGSGSVNLANSIVARNTALEPFGPSLFPDCMAGPSQPFVSSGHNLIGDGSGCPGLLDGTNGDQVGTSEIPIDARLGSLAANGGPTETHRLLVGSPAIDAGDPSGCTDADGSSLTVDQRGVPRPFDGDDDGVPVCDIGAVEFVPEPAEALLHVVALAPIAALARIRRSV